MSSRFAPPHRLMGFLVLFPRGPVIRRHSKEESGMNMTKERFKGQAVSQILNGHPDRHTLQPHRISIYFRTEIMAKNRRKCRCRRLNPNFSGKDHQIEILQRYRGQSGSQFIVPYMTSILLQDTSGRLQHVIEYRTKVNSRQS